MLSTLHDRGSAPAHDTAIEHPGVRDLVAIVNTGSFRAGSRLPLAMLEVPGYH
jgi:hypothetical protein